MSQDQARGLLCVLAIAAIAFNLQLAFEHMSQKMRNKVLDWILYTGASFVALALVWCFGYATYVVLSGGGT